MKVMRIAALSAGMLLSACAGWADAPRGSGPQASTPQASGATKPAATQGAKPQAANSTTPKSIEDVVWQRVSAKVPGTVKSVHKLPFGMFEVVIDSEIVYVDETADYLITGAWAEKAYQEAATIGTVREAATTKATGYKRVPRPDEITGTSVTP